MQASRKRVEGGAGAAPAAGELPPAPVEDATDAADGGGSGASPRAPTPLFASRAAAGSAQPPGSRPRSRASTVEDAIRAAAARRVTRGQQQQQQQLQARASQKQAAALAPNDAELVVLGEIVGLTLAASSGGCAAGGSFSCSWELAYDPKHFTLVRGEARGRTHASGPALGSDGPAAASVWWEHPIAFVLSPRSRQRWPSLIFKLHRRSMPYARDAFFGYALAQLPAGPGPAAVTCCVWQPAQAARSLGQAMLGWFGGVAPQLVDESFLTDLDQRFELGQQGLHTQGVGARLTLRLHVLARNCSALPLLARDATAAAGGASGHLVARIVAMAADDREEGDDAAAESEGLRHVRAGRAARLLQQRPPLR